MFVGEAPGEVEDESGIAFAGRAGILLTELLEEFGWSREAIYIANCIKCRPPQNRDPEPEELKVCSPFLEKQIFSIRPEVIVALGKYSAQMLIGEEVSISRMRGRIWHTKYGRIVPTYHPAYILRNPTEVSKIREDFQLAMDFLHR
jgi:DNA polymerase